MVWALLACTSPDPTPAPNPPAPSAPSTSRETTTYVVSFEERSHHRVHVVLQTQCPEPGTLNLWMPVWTPGSYLVREYSRLVERVRTPVGPAQKVAKNRWTAACTPGPVDVQYTVVGQAFTVRENTITSDLAALNGAATFLVPEGAGNFSVRFELPEGFSVASTLEGTDGVYHANNVDLLFDNPFLLGALAEATVHVRGIPHRVVVAGHDRAPDPTIYEPQKLADAAGALAEQVHAIFGAFPYARYTFLTMVGGPGSGGLEHADGSLLSLAVGRDPHSAAVRGLFGHELFHAWNGKRMRPVGFGPFDYEQEVYTDALWVVEGFTAYYDDIVTVRAGLATEDELLHALGGAIRQLEALPGRAVQPLAEASFDAWVGQYRPDEDSPNRNVDYYGKGAVVAWLLDAEIRRTSGDRASLDTAMRRLWDAHATVPYTTAAVRAAASEAAGQDLTVFFDHAVDGVAELDYASALQWFGLQFAAPEKGTSLGAVPKTVDGRLVFTEVRRNTPAWRAGVSVADELLALDDRRVLPDTLEPLLAALEPGYTGTLWVARRGRVLQLPITLDALPGRQALEIDPGASPQARRRRARWLAPR